MIARHPLPRIWLVTDERQGDRLLSAVAKLPPQAGILFRHYNLPEPDRRRLFDDVLAEARREERMVFLAGPSDLAANWGADGWHGWGHGPGVHSASVHNLGEVRRAEGEGAELLFLSPVYPTRSHPAASGLGLEEFARLAAEARRPVIALGGVTAERAPKLMELGAYGWAGVDAWTA